MLRKELDRLDKSELKNTWAIQASDFQYLKFLIGHKMKVDEAFKLMVKCSAWRYEFKTSELISKMEALNAPPEVRFAKAYLPMGVIGRDSEGRPVMLQRISAIDFPRVIGDFGLDKVIEYATNCETNFSTKLASTNCVANFTSTYQLAIYLSLVILASTNFVSIRYFLRPIIEAYQ